MRRIILAATLSLLIPELVAAQQATATLPAGTTIRVTAPQALTERTTGAFQAARSDSLWMHAGRSRQLVIPVAAVERLEVSKGRARLKWALIGAGSGALAGFVLGGMAGGKDDITGTGAATGAIAGTAQGIVLGAIGGALLAPRRWVGYPVSALR
ncbi:MAG TPA: hypothetical protein VFT96_04640 [Gemmatimonadaceae bacterium]|nr:hypothetical protein [Gemmatimonadaceae bacterium]